MPRHARSRRGIDRRSLLKGVAAGGLATGLGDLTLAADAKPTLEGYAGRLSYRAGEAVGLHVSTSLRKYSIEIARVGSKREVVWTRRDLPGVRHPVPANAASHGCGWPAAVEVVVPAEWASGYYSAMLRGEENGRPVEGELYFVVRAAQPGKNAKILLALATNTYNAYNTWGGSSLYGGTRGQGTRVSFERPNAGFVPDKVFTNTYSGYRNWELPFVAWAENAGYRIDYAVNDDLEFRPEILKPYRLVLSVGHDEYWSAPMRDALEAFIAAGGNAAFFSGNTCFWQVRSEDGGRALTSYKQFFKKDPVYPTADHRFLSGMWSHRLIDRPENRLTGVSFAYGGYHRFFEQFVDGAGGYTVHRPEHWLFAGTGLKRGDLLGIKDKVVGYECDGCAFTLQNGLPVPTHRDGTPESFEILGTCPAGLSVRDNSLGWVQEALYGDKKDRHPQPGAAVLGSYTSGGTVVTTGCTEWPNGLRGKDPVVERITRNILDRLSA